MTVHLCKRANAIAKEATSLRDAAHEIGGEHGYDSALFLVAERIAADHAARWYSLRRRINAINSRVMRHNQRIDGGRGKRRVIE
jgi:hypothetical protein